MTSPQSTGQGAGIQVRLEELTAHAGHVWSVSEEIGRTQSAADTVGLNHDAFGLLISFVGGWLQDIEHQVADKYRQTTQDLMNDSLNLRGAAQQYEYADSQAAGHANATQTKRIELPL